MMPARVKPPTKRRRVITSLILPLQELYTRKRHGKLPIPLALEVKLRLSPTRDRTGAKRLSVFQLQSRLHLDCSIVGPRMPWNQGESQAPYADNSPPPPRRGFFKCLQFAKGVCERSEPGPFCPRGSATKWEGMLGAQGRHAKRSCERHTFAAIGCDR
jgi:hypothetical protein